MYGSSSVFEESMFKGRVLQEVSLSVNTMVFCFDNSITITLLGAYGIGSGDNVCANVMRVPNCNSEIISLLGREVTKSDRGGDGRLVLWFGDIVLTILDDSTIYESYIIKNNDKEYIV